MRPNLIMALLVAILLSCSKKQEQPETTEATSTSTAAQQSDGQLELTPELTEQINIQLFLYFHQQHMMYEPLVLASIEEFTTNGAEFEYRLIRDNMDMGGWHDPAEFQVSSGDETSDDSDDNSDSGDGDDGGSAPAYYEQTPQMTYTNQIDTVIVKGSYLAYGTTPGYWDLKTTGKFSQPTMVFVEDDEIVKRPYLADIGPIILTAGAFSFDRSKLYLKARIKELADADLAGMNKDELGYFRNEIFARHGHTFKTPKMVKYFGKQDWYKQNVDDATPLLNKFEKLNIDFIKKKEG